MRANTATSCQPERGTPYNMYSAEDSPAGDEPGRFSAMGNTDSAIALGSLVSLVTVGRRGWGVERAFQLGRRHHDSKPN